MQFQGAVSYFATNVLEKLKAGAYLRNNNKQNVFHS